MCGWGRQSTPNSQESKVKQFCANASIALKDPRKEDRSQRRRRVSCSSVSQHVLRGSWASGYSVAPDSKCRCRGIGPSFHIFFLQVLQVSYVHYHEKNTGLESIISLQHRNSDCLRSMKELCSVHPFKTYFK